MKVTVLGACDTGVVVEQDDSPSFQYFLTPCCGATAKGAERGVVCRACYKSIDPALGDIYSEAFYGPLRPLTDQERTVVDADNVVFADA